MMDNLQLVIVAAVAATQQLLAAYSIIFDDVLTRVERRRAKRHKRELTSYKGILPSVTVTRQPT
jgi:hypothetical protein